MPDETFSNGPLSDLRVIEMGTLLAGPFCGQILGDMGAEVIKVEPPNQGDPMRVWGRQKQGDPSLWWPVVARNKKAITLDLRQPEGQRVRPERQPVRRRPELRPERVRRLLLSFRRRTRSARPGRQSGETVSWQILEE